MGRQREPSGGGRGDRPDPAIQLAHAVFGLSVHWSRCPGATPTGTTRTTATAGTTATTWARRTARPPPIHPGAAGRGAGAAGRTAAGAAGDGPPGAWRGPAAAAGRTRAGKRPADDQRADQCGARRGGGRGGARPTTAASDGGVTPTPHLCRERDGRCCHARRLTRERAATHPRSGYVLECGARHTRH